LGQHKRWVLSEAGHRSNQAQIRTMRTPNDEPVYEDALGHYPLARKVGHRLLHCTPPYVIGVCGAWGSGKTSFLKKLWAYLGGPFEMAGRNGGKSASLQSTERKKWFVESATEFNRLLKRRDGKRKLELIWFNPWQHQFERSPLVALLYEIRHHFSFKRKLFDEAGKLANVSIGATLDALTDFGKGLKIPLPSAKGISERGREYESQRFSSPLTSQRFRDFFEGAIGSVTGKNGLLVIFIDDLDRCEGDVAYRLLEALKLYLNADNCVYVLGLDQKHLENSIAKSLSGEKEAWRFRPVARDYLSKIFQNLFLLPVPRRTSGYIEQILDLRDQDFEQRLERLFGLQEADWPLLVTALDANLPHNPRKIKAFVSSWKLYLDSLPEAPGLDWRLTLILHYLAQFEEPLFRKVEEAPAFYSDHIVNFCRGGYDPHPLFEGLERPYEMSKSDSGSEETGGFGTSRPTGSPDIPPQEEESKRLPQPRIFWISRLAAQLAKDTTYHVSDEIIQRHLMQSGGQ
ncbi:MAG: P-loop NTPase fold protein, partial [Acidobacteriota bacterium]